MNKRCTDIYATIDWNDVIKNHGDNEGSNDDNDQHNTGVMITLMIATSTTKALKYATATTISFRIEIWMMR